MAQDDFDFQAFVHLQGREGKAPLGWGLLVSGILFLAGLLLLMSENGWAA